MQDKKIIEQMSKVRDSLDAKKKKREAYIEEQTILATYYANALTGGDFSYCSDQLAEYLKDYFLRGVSIAEEVIKQAVLKEYLNTSKHYGSLATLCTTAADQKAYIELGSLLKQFHQTIEAQETLNKHNGKIAIAEKYQFTENEYKVTDAAQYVRDWLDGFNAAEGYIIRVCKESPETLEKVFDELKDDAESQKLIDLMVKTQNEFTPEDETSHILLTLSFVYKQKLLNSNSHQNTAAVLDEAFDIGILDRVLGKKDWYTTFKSRTLGTNPLRYIKNSEVIAKVCMQTTGENRDYFIRLIFDYTLVVELAPRKAIFEGALKLLKKYLGNGAPKGEQASSKSILNKRVIIVANEDIRIDYYLASMNNDIEALVDLAWKRNPKMFKELFLCELGVVDEQLMEGATRKREKFYRDLLNHNHMVLHDDYQTLLSAVNKVFTGERHRLQVVAEKKIETQTPMLMYPQKPTINQDSYIEEGTTPKPASIISAAESKEPKSTSTSTISDFFSFFTSKEPKPDAKNKKPWYVFETFAEKKSEQKTSQQKSPEVKIEEQDAVTETAHSFYDKL